MAAKTSSDHRGGFSAVVTRADARRQLRMSVGVVAVIAAGIMSAALSLGPHPIPAKRDVVSTAPTFTLRAETSAVGAKAI